MDRDREEAMAVRNMAIAILLAILVPCIVATIASQCGYGTTGYGILTLMMIGALFGMDVIGYHNDAFVNGKHARRFLTCVVLVALCFTALQPGLTQLGKGSASQVNQQD